MCLVLLMLFGLIRGIDAATEPGSGNADALSAEDGQDPNDGWWKQWDAVVENPDDPNELVRAKLNAVITVLRTDQLKPALKPVVIEKIITPVFDFDLMSMLVLGRTHWSRFTPAQRQTFTELFTEMLKRSYQEKITLYTDQEIELGTSRPQRMGINIPMDILTDGDRVSVLYKLRETDGQWRIYDVDVEGVSILLTYRSQFDDILRRGGAASLFAELEKSITR